jgi:hypothetical protein
MTLGDRRQTLADSRVANVPREDVANLYMGPFQASSSSNSTGGSRSPPKQTVLAANIACTELLFRCGPYCDSPNLKRPNLNSVRDRGQWGRDAAQNQLGSRGFNARDDCPYLCVGFNCGDAHRALAAFLNRLLLFCTSVESGNTASLCVRRRSRSQPNSHFAGVDDHARARRSPGNASACSQTALCVVS